ncbi:flagellar biosynthesis protein FlhF [Natroniella sulfidigena]|uniref:flagellar biosynthesis protein FlhF n=1 Tax=Natroniella sulfidigena TaxID=723921 RepID=UPI00200A8301|nr:flagellar biosynthesis protein FlhF [Natroniella sulfidigena]MCK8816512.1 flagellar biosynthesis protein FlhF [Natroniella sulfidigena]
MKIKKYRGENMKEVVAKVKSDLGSDAVILNTRKFKTGGIFGLFAKEMVEVLASSERKEDEKRENGKLEHELQEMKSMMDNLMGEMKNNRQQKLSLASNQNLQELIDALLELGISHDMASELASKVVRQLGAYTLEDQEMIKEILQEELAKQLDNIEPIQLEDGRTKVVALVGSTGVGKTTTLAKLAANFALFENKKVGLITADTYRISAVDQLKTYSEIIDLPLEVVFTPQELVTAIEKYQGYDLVLIDTAGRSQNNQVHMSELKSFIKKAPIDEVYLVLSATTKIVDMMEVIDIYQKIDLDKLIITKIDETNSLGVIFEIMAKIEKPLSYVTLGQDVPEDIKIAESDELAADIIKGFEL